MKNPINHYWVQGCVRGGASLCLLIAVLAAGSVFWSRGQLRTIHQSVKVSAESPPLYLPAVDKVRLATLGFDNFFADLLWFNTLNYFGKQMTEERDYRWLGNMCELVIDLNPRTRQIAEFCSTMLSWVAEQQQQSIVILKKAIEAEPDYWRYRYLLGFNYWYFQEDFNAAAQTLQEAALLPDCPPFVASLAARIIANESSPQMAISFLRNLLKREKDKNARAALEEKLKLATISRDLQTLEGIANQYQEKFQQRPTTLQQLVAAKLLPGIPLDPFGDRYRISPETGKMDTSTDRKGLSFPGKTAKTGLANSDH